MHGKGSRGDARVATTLSKTIVRASRIGDGSSCTTLDLARFRVEEMHAELSAMPGNLPMKKPTEKQPAQAQNAFTIPNTSSFKPAAPSNMQRRAVAEVRRSGGKLQGGTSARGGRFKI